MNNIKSQCTKIKMLISDVDGVLTDGSIYKGSDGSEFKKFSIEDGAGPAIARAAGLKLALISGRYSKATALRAAEMKIEEVHNGTLNKCLPYEEIKAKFNLKNEEIAYLGDDLIDIAVMEQVGIPMAVANAIEMVKEISIYITKKPGGQGAFREAIEWIIDQQGRHEEVLNILRKKVQESSGTST